MGCDWNTFVRKEERSIRVSYNPPTKPQTESSTPTPKDTYHCDDKPMGVTRCYKVEKKVKKTKTKCGVFCKVWGVWGAVKSFFVSSFHIFASICERNPRACMSD